MNNTRINQKKKLRSLIVPKEIELLICSTGGVGTTFYLNQINNYKVTKNINAIFILLNKYQKLMKYYMADNQ